MLVCVLCMFSCGCCVSALSLSHTHTDSGVGAGIDSYYEYCLKSYILLGDMEYLHRFNKVYSLLASEASKPSCSYCAHDFSLYLYIYIYIYIFPGQCHTVISNLAITRIILNPFYNAAVYTAYTLHS